MQDDPSYVAYRQYAIRIGNPNVMDYETWARTAHKLGKSESNVTALREKWLQSDAATKTNLAVRRHK